MLNNVFFVSNKILIKNHFSLFTRILSTAKASSCIGKRQSRTVNLRNFNKSKKNILISMEISKFAIKTTTMLRSMWRCFVMNMDR